jgi:hypothetical protein
VVGPSPVSSGLKRNGYHTMQSGSLLSDWKCSVLDETTELAELPNHSITVKTTKGSALIRNDHGNLVPSATNYGHQRRIMV